MGHFWCWFHDTRTFGNSLQFATEALGHLWILYVEDDVSKIVIFHTKLLNYRDFLHSRSQGTQRTVVKSSCRRENDTFSINRICRISGVQPPVRGPRGLDWGTDIFNQGGNPWKFNQNTQNPNVIPMVTAVNDMPICSDDRKTITKHAGANPMLAHIQIKYPDIPRQYYILVT